MVDLSGSIGETEVEAEEVMVVDLPEDTDQVLVAETGVRGGEVVYVALDEGSLG